jgi:DNA-directed RNA polymerase subunit beta
VNPGDILVGKITPKGESPMTPEEKLLRAIFGEKASDVRDTSLRCRPGVAGTVVEVRVFNRHGVDKDERAMAIEREEIERLAKDRDDEQAILDRNVYGRLADMLMGKSRQAGPKGFKKGVQDHRTCWTTTRVRSGGFASRRREGCMGESKRCASSTTNPRSSLEQRFMDKVEKLQRGDELPPGVMKMVKVFVAVKRKIQPGDKMAGRHGNKGVVSRIVPQRGHAVPGRRDAGRHRAEPARRAVSRMNVGQILETHMGWACRGLGRDHRRRSTSLPGRARCGRCKTSS